MELSHGLVVNGNYPNDAGGRWCLLGSGRCAVGCFCGADGSPSCSGSQSSPVNFAQVCTVVDAIHRYLTQIPYGLLWTASDFLENEWY
jgi:hypothetical protein